MDNINQPPPDPQDRTSGPQHRTNDPTPRTASGLVVPLTVDILIGSVRRARGLNQGDTARLLGAVSGLETVTRREVSRWETGARVPTRYWMNYLAVILQIPVGDLAYARQVSWSLPAHAVAVSPQRAEVIRDIGAQWREQRGVKPDQVLSDDQATELSRWVADALPPRYMEAI